MSMQRICAGEIGREHLGRKVAFSKRHRTIDGDLLTVKHTAEGVAVTAIGPKLGLHGIALHEHEEIEMEVPE